MRLEATTTARPIAMPRETASPWIANVIAPVLCLLLRRLRAVAMRQRPGPARVALLRSPSASAAEAHHWPSPNLSLIRAVSARSEEHTSELQSQSNLVCRLLLEKKKKN